MARRTYVHIVTNSIASGPLAGPAASRLGLEHEIGCRLARGDPHGDGAVDAALGALGGVLGGLHGEAPGGRLDDEVEGVAGPWRRRRRAGGR